MRPSGAGGRRPGARLLTGGLLLLLPLLPFAAGCDRGADRREGGPEVGYLTSTPPPLTPPTAASRDLLPTTPGATWEMIGTPAPWEPPVSAGPDGRRPQPVRYEVRVAGPAPADAGCPDGILVEVRRNGRIWRREVYRSAAEGLYLAATAEEQRPFMVYSPPVPLVRSPLAEGQTIAWTGTFRYAGRNFPASAVSRLSSIERLAGRDLAACRVDTQINANFGDGITKFPTVRWMAPGIGFVRRAFIDQGRGVYVNLVRYRRSAAEPPLLDLTKRPAGVRPPATR